MDIKQKMRVAVSGVVVEGRSAATSFNTDAIDLRNYSKGWVLQVFRSLTDGTPKITIQGSQDGTEWGNYSSVYTDISIPLIRYDIEYLPNYIRFVYTATGSPTGTVTIYFYKAG